MLALILVLARIRILVRVPPSTGTVEIRMSSRLRLHESSFVFRRRLVNGLVFAKTSWPVEAVLGVTVVVALLAQPLLSTV